MATPPAKFEGANEGEDVTRRDEAEEGARRRGEGGEAEAVVKRARRKRRRREREF